jgi:hypothetical protein
VVLHGKDRHEAASSMDEYDLVIASTAFAARPVNAGWRRSGIWWCWTKRAKHQNASTNAAGPVTNQTPPSSLARPWKTTKEIWSRLF